MQQKAAGGAFWQRGTRFENGVHAHNVLALGLAAFCVGWPGPGRRITGGRSVRKVVHSVRRGGGGGVCARCCKLEFERLVNWDTLGVSILGGGGAVQGPRPGAADFTLDLNTALSVLSCT